MGQMRIRAGHTQRKMKINSNCLNRAFDAFEWKTFVCTKYN